MMAAITIAATQSMSPHPPIPLVLTCPFFYLRGRLNIFIINQFRHIRNMYLQILIRNL